MDASVEILMDVRSCICTAVCGMIRLHVMSTKLAHGLPLPLVSYWDVSADGYYITHHVPQPAILRVLMRWIPQ